MLSFRVCLDKKRESIMYERLANQANVTAIHCIENTQSFRPQKLCSPPTWSVFCLTQLAQNAFRLLMSSSGVACGA